MFQSLLPSSHWNSYRTGQDGFLHDNLSAFKCGKCERYCSDRLRSDLLTLGSDLVCCHVY